ncbi:hypothetical protein FEM48_Zijuj04G0089100 [Ziziphus jujuba var. spinosa]|uniref:EXPERA domain-containing protein n=1 Tax=Ziziphus jujuba var. spinosa TaxID=714518 RepID=A0A978VIY4_ZIZJJ|nr:hypothetical protein FEM48_Zijuj04G0089100 [Ziziphus jujuba var. spinosa]
MGIVINLIDALLFSFFLSIAILTPLIDAQICLPHSHTFYPDLLLDATHWYTNEFGDYLVAEKPDFFVGIIWVELLLQWPLALVNLYGILASKPWFNTTCLCYGVSAFTANIPIIVEMMGSGKATEKMFMMYHAFLGFGVLAILRGFTMRLFTIKTASSSKRPPLPKKKRI